MTEPKSSSVAPWDPFEDFFPRWSRYGRSPALRAPLAEGWSPALDVSETEDAFVVTVELAGAKKEDVTVESHDNVVTIRGEKRSERNEETETRRYVERSYGTFSRSFSLPPNADGGRVEASFKDGVLTVEIAKRVEAKPKTIAVKGG